MQIGEGLAKQLWDAIVTGAIWMFTIKYPDETDFAFWVGTWILVFVMSIPVFSKIIKHAKNKFDL
jgi:hypothetical protein